MPVEITDIVLEFCEHPTDQHIKISLKHGARAPTQRGSSAIPAAGALGVGVRTGDITESQNITE